MNWDRIEGNWKQCAGSVREKWGRLTHDQLETIAGKRDALAGKIQEIYGLTREATERQISEWQDTQKNHRGNEMKNTTTMTVLATAIALSFGAAALADSMTKPQHTSAKNEIEATYKAAKVSCDALKANAKDICIAEAKGKEKVALADLEVTYKPTTKARYEARVARADAVYSLAKEKCDDLAGNAKDVCRKEADTAHVAAKADAKAQMKTVDANKDAGKVTANANEKATKKIAEAHKDAAEDKREAEYALAKEKCDAAAGAAKDACMADAKARYGKS